MEQQERVFEQITSLFYNSQYEIGKQKISKLIENDPSNSMLYTNRALFQSQLGQDLMAISDLEEALKQNPFNYIAYFNLFSLKTRNNEDRQALDNLYCSLSCLYLIKGKASKDIPSVDKSISYTLNNAEAHTLKCLLLLETKNIQESYTQIEIAFKINQSNPTINKIINYLSKCIYQRQHTRLEVDKTEKTNNRRLQGRILLSKQADIIQEINKKVDEFNTLYREVNLQIGAITHKIPKDIPNSIKTFMREKSKLTSNQESAIAILQDDDYFNHAKSNSTLYIQYPNLQDTNPEHLTQLNPSQGDFKNKNNYEKYQCYSVDSGKIRLNSVIIQEQINDQFDQSWDRSNHNIRATVNNTKFIYPLKDRKKLKINIIHFSFFEIPLQTFKNVYCVINYDNGRVKYRSDPVKCQEEICPWNQQFTPVEIAREPAQMWIKIYNKTFNELRDTFLGEIEVLIETADLVKLPIYTKNNDILGQLLMHLQLVDESQV